ncbi:MAG: hypothetical protein PF569_04730 [Candidatus Woesearchaeota archaeon]|jgi:hypothetical protein|nr:hypothetical protein [Candidatus Woesearchaeota archaeon]
MKITEKLITDQELKQIYKKFPNSKIYPEWSKEKKEEKRKEILEKLKEN